MAQLRFFDYEAAYTYYCDRIDHMRRGSTKTRGVKIIAKPMLVLAIIKGIDEGRFTINRFTYEGLDGIYTALFRKHFMEALQDNLTPLCYPFYYLQSDDFWHFSWCPGASTSTDSPSVAWLRRNCNHAYIDTELWLLLQMREYRRRLAEYVLDTQVKVSLRSEGMVAERSLFRTLLALFAVV